MTAYEAARRAGGTMVGMTVNPDESGLFYPQLDPGAPENLVPEVQPFSKLWYSGLPVFVREADQVQNLEAGGWPLLRFLDTAGRIADDVREVVQQMYSGVWTDPAQVPARGLRWLAAVLGVPSSQKQVPDAQLREALVDLTENGRPPSGTRVSIAAVAKQFLTGTKEIQVRPAAGIPSFMTAADQALVSAVGFTDTRGVAVSPQPPLFEVTHTWAGARHNSASERRVRGVLIGTNIVPNPCFGLGSAQGWSGASATLTVGTDKSGPRGIGRALTVTQTGTGDGRVFMLPKPGAGGQEWTWSVWVRTNGTVTVAPDLFNYATNTSGASVVPLPFMDYRVVPAAGMWTKLTLRAYLPPSVTMVRGVVRLVGTSGTAASIEIGDASLAPSSLDSPDYFDGDHPSAVPTDYFWEGARLASPSKRIRGQEYHENLVHNPQFATLTGWNSTRVSGVHDTSVKETGIASWKITPTDVGWYALEQYRVAPEPGQYVFRARVMTSTPGRLFRLRVWQYDGGDTAVSSDFSLQPNVWTWVELSLSIASQGHRYRISITDSAGEAANTNPLWIDRMYLARARYAVPTYFDGDTPDSWEQNLWVNTTTSLAHTWDGTGWIQHSASTAQAAAVVAERAGGDMIRAHTIVITARPDEIPNLDLAGLATSLRSVGIIPAGHNVIVESAETTWDGTESVLTDRGGTWDAYEAATVTWADWDALGLESFGE